MRIGGGNGNPLQCSCLENPRDGGAWWAAICGVAQSWTRLKQLSSSSSKLILIPRKFCPNIMHCFLLLSSYVHCGQAISWLWQQPKCLSTEEWIHVLMHAGRFLVIYNFYFLEPWFFKCKNRYCTVQPSLVAQTVKNLSAVQETWVQSVGWEDRLEKGMATYSSILAWRISTGRGIWWGRAHGVTKSWCD